MSGALIFFLLVGAVAVGSALAMVLTSNTVHSALFLLVNLFSLAVLYLTLGADFLAAVQVIIYAGAIMVLFMFVITLLSPGSEGPLGGVRGRTAPALALCLALLVEMGLLLRTGTLPPAGSGPAVGIEQVGEALFTRYLFPFEVVSLLLLVAVVGAIVLARRRGADELGTAAEPEEAVSLAR